MRITIEPIFSRDPREIQEDKKRFIQSVVDEIERSVLVFNWRPIPWWGKKFASLAWEAYRLEYIVWDKWKEALVLKHTDWEQFVKFVKENKKVDWDMNTIVEYIIWKQNKFTS